MVGGGGRRRSPDTSLETARLPGLCGNLQKPAYEFCLRECHTEKKDAWCTTQDPVEGFPRPQACQRRLLPSVRIPRQKADRAEKGADAFTYGLFRVSEILRYCS